MEVIAVIRDISIILMTLAGFVFFVLLAVIAFIGLRLFLRLKSQVPTVLGTVHATTQSVKGTTEFVSDTVVTPLIRIAALTAAISRFVAVLFGGQRSRVR